MMATKAITEVKELKECETINEANKYIEEGDWILLKVYMDTQLCFSKVTVGENNFQKVQPFDKVIKLYIIGRIK